MTSKSLLLDANSGPESSGTGLKSGSAYDLVDLVTLAPLSIDNGIFLILESRWSCVLGKI